MNKTSGCDGIPAKLFKTLKHNAMVTHLEADMQECEVKWVLGDITMKKLVEVMEVQLSYFKS